MEGEGAKEADLLAEKELEKIVGDKISKFEKQMDSDLNTPEAIAELIEASKEIARARSENKCSKERIEKEAGRIVDAFAMLGIDAKMKVNAAKKIEKQEIEKMLAEREDARKKKDFAAADAIRKKLAGAGVIIEDSKEGARWRYS